MAGYLLILVSVSTDLGGQGLVLAVVILGVLDDGGQVLAQGSTIVGGVLSGSDSDAAESDGSSGSSSNGTPAPSGGSGLNDLMSGFEGMNFGGEPSHQPLPAAMQLHNAQGGEGQGPKKDSDDLLGLL